MQPFKIGERLIGPGHPPFVIAEAGINHNGDFNKAIQLVDAAKNAGADCIKFQCHITEAELVPTEIRPGYISKESLWDITKRIELTREEDARIQQYCRQKEIIYLNTPFSKEAAQRLQSLDIPAFKIGSGECNNIPLLKFIAKMGKPMILSTGMNDIESIKKSVKAIQDYDCPFMLMHCISIYPTPYDKVCLAGIKELQDKFGVPVGFSDHTLGIYASLAAVALGACVLEKHFTVSRSWPGPDIYFSTEAKELAELIKGSKAISLALKGEKTVFPDEEPIMNFAFASVVAIKDIRKGDSFDSSNIWVKKPGIGEIRAERFDSILGKTAKVEIKRGQQLNWRMIDE